MNRYLPLIETHLATIARFDHPGEQPHYDPAEEVAADRSIGLVEQGRFSVQIGRRVWDLSPGDVFLTFPGLVYRVRHREPAPTDVCLSVSYSDCAIDTGNFDHLARRCPVIPATNRLTYLFRAFSGVPATTANLAAEDVAAALFCEVSVPSAQGTKSFSPRQLAWYAERVDAIRARLENQFASDHSLMALARSVGMSPFHFARVFRELAGTPPHRYLMQVRMKEAARQLRAGASVTDACLDTGFSNLSHFIRLFQRWHGVSPARYARQRAS